MVNQISSSCPGYSPDKALEERPLLSLSDTHRHQSWRLMEESVCGTTSEPFEEKSLDSFVPKSESEFVEYAELITRKLRSFEKHHHYVAFLKVMNELTLGPLTAADAEEVVSSLTMIAQKKQNSQKQNTDTHKGKHLHMDKLLHSSVFNWLVFWRRCKPFETLPENLLIEILTRLPAEDVLRCHLVCRKWREVTSTPCFVAKHAERAPKVLIVHEDETRFSGSFFVFGETKKKPLIDQVETRYFFTCRHLSKSLQGCNGLLLQKTHDARWELTICNPFTGEQLPVQVPRDGRDWDAYGFFFHPDKGDYRVLCGKREGGRIVYMIFSLGTRSWRTLNKTFSYRPDPKESHVMANRSLYWRAVEKVGYDYFYCKELIMTFNIDTEEFASRSHPRIEGCSKTTHENMHLMEGEGESLLFAHVFCGMMTIWSLEDYAGWGWKRKYQIDLKWKVLNKPFSGSYESIRPVCIQGDQLLIIWDCRGVFLYHVKRGTVEKVGIKWWGDNDRTKRYAGSYRKTFVPLEGAKRYEVFHNRKLFTVEEKWRNIQTYIVQTHQDSKAC